MDWERGGPAAEYGTRTDIKFASMTAGVIVVIVTTALLAGCGTANGGDTSQPSRAASSAPPVGPSFSCDVGQVISALGSENDLEFTATVNDSTPLAITVNSVSVVFLGSNGRELGSNTAVPFAQVVAAGQSLTRDLSAAAPAGTTTCQIAGYS